MSSSILKKGQMEMFETIGVLFVFFLLLAFGLIFYAGFQKDSMSSMSADKVELDLVSLAQTISSITELKCTEQDSVVENCYDKLLIEILSNYTSDENKPYSFLNSSNPDSRLYYYDLFGNSNITVSIFDEENKKFTNYQIYNNPNGKKNKRTNYVPIIIKDARTQEYSFGILYLTIYV